MKNALQIILYILCINTFAQNGYKAKGEASYYGDKLNGATTASGEIFSNSKFTAAHLTLPFGTFVKVTNPENDKSVIVRINDRGPRKSTGRIIDLSKVAAQELGFVKKGLAEVLIEEIENSEITEEEVFEVAKDTIKKKEELVKEVVSDSKLVKEKKNEEVNFNHLQYYVLDSKKVNVKGFGVQIGNYLEMVNLMEVSTKLKEMFSYEVHVKVDKKDDKKFYKLTLGNFKSKEKANEAKVKIKDQFPDCFVIEY